MILSDILIIVGIVLANLTALIISWNKTLLKIKELEVKLQTHIDWGEKEQLKNLETFKKIDNDLKENQETITRKLDIIIERFNSFQVYCEKNFGRKN